MLLMIKQNRTSYLESDKQHISASTPVVYRQDCSAAANSHKFENHRLCVGIADGYRLVLRKYAI